MPFSAPEFAAFIWPPLSRSKRGPQGKSGYHKPCNSRLQVLSPGRQWKELPLDKGPQGKAELPETGGCKLLARWAQEGSLERAFLASVQHLDEAKRVALSLLPGAGTNPGANKGARVLATGATNTRKARQCSP